MSRTTPFLISALCLIVIVMTSTTSNFHVEAMNFAEQIAEQQQAAGKSSASLAVIENPELVVRVLDNLLRSIMYSLSVDVQANQNNAQKRGLDLGISRGFSGSQAGKHLMGLSAASFANGPGRR